MINWEMRKGRGWMKGVKEERLVKAKSCIKTPTQGLVLYVCERETEVKRCRDIQEGEKDRRIHEISRVETKDFTSWV